ncbi:MAG TPA: hypothetical protein VGS20_05245 [Candidatus Acidoferrales bacterium]|nr:hypothetical protein [Candidatus Acidoferrales bacterium]
MILRIWRGQTTIGNADSYFRHLTGTVLPGLTGIRGFLGRIVLRRPAAGRIEFLVVTRWESVRAIREFAGEQVETAVVQPGARALLADYDEFVRHYELVYSSRGETEALG